MNRRAADNTEQRGLKLFLKIIMLLGGVLIFFPVIFVYGPKIEMTVNPILKHVRYLHAEVYQDEKGKFIDYDVFGEKARACRYLGTSALAGPRADGYLEAVNVSFPEAVGKDVTRPPGKQSFGTWRVGPIEANDQVFFLIRYRCHTLWDVNTTIGPWATMPVIPSAPPLPAPVERK